MKLCRGSFDAQTRHLVKNVVNTDSILRANEQSIKLKDQAILRIDVSQLAANKPVEDYFSAAKCLSSNAYLFGIFDGHAGGACSRNVSTRLFDYLCAAILKKHYVVNLPLVERLQWLFSSANSTLLSHTNYVHQQNVKKFYEKFTNSNDLVTVRKAMQSACLALDDDLSNSAMPDINGKIDKLNVNVISSGSCALVAHIRFNNLHVANIGDSEAILGVKHTNGIISRLLSKPHTADFTDEVNRIRNAHPASEIQTVLRGNRLLGELYPLRAFGDVRYKWTAELQHIVLEPLGITPPIHLYTPPYLTAMPEVLYHQLTPNDKFLVLASDGLWEWLDSDAVVQLINDHNLGTQTLSPYVPKPNYTLKEVLIDLSKRKKGDVKQPIDTNSATYLIRNALGGCSGGEKLQYERLQKTLQLPPGTARNFRDDITVMVIHFNESFLNNMNKDSDED